MIRGFIARRTGRLCDWQGGQVSSVDDLQSATMGNKSVLIWLDDERDPSEPRWRDYFPVAKPTVIWLQCFDAFVAWIDANGLPDAISFDHDLGDGPSGMDAAKYVVEYCLDHQATLPTWGVHSANPVGADNIHALLNSFQRHSESKPGP